MRQPRTTIQPEGCTPIQPLLQRAEHYMDQAVSKSTHRMYHSAWDTFVRFTVMYGMVDILECPDYVREQGMIAFIIFCAEQLSLTHNSIKSYLCAIKYFYSRQSLIRDPFLYENGTPFTKFRLVLKGISRTNSVSRVKRDPITPEILKAMISILQVGFLGKYLDIMYQAIFLSAFHGFLRCGEFTSPTAIFDSTHGLTRADIKVQGAGPHRILQIHLRYSKTDPTGQGVVVQLFPLHTVLCPVQAVEEYLPLRESLGGDSLTPFFMMPSHLPLTRCDFALHLGQVLQCIGLGQAYIRPHSFRIGAATAAAKAGVPDHLIKTLGRWSSDSYQRYIRTPSSRLASAQRAMARLCQ